MPAPKFGPLSNYIDLLLDTVCVVDIEGRFVYVSAGCERVFGYTQEEMTGRFITELLHPDDREITLRAAREVMQGKPLPYFENRYIRKDGSIAHIMWSARWSEDDKLRIAVARDISSRVRSEAKQRATYAISEAAHTTSDLPELFRLIHKIVADLLPVDSFCIALYENSSESNNGFSRDNKPGSAHKKIRGTSHLSIAYTHPAAAHAATDLPGDKRPASDHRLQLATQIIQSQSNLLTHVHADVTGVVNWIGVPLRAQKNVVGALLVSRDSSAQNFSDVDQELLHFVSLQIAAAVERQQMLNHLQQLALYDSLTQLPNRSLFEDRMRSALARARRDKAQLSLLYIDLDRFKEVNDNFGHAIGDLLLTQVARRLESCLRECDTVARLSGDEFVVLLENMDHDNHADTVSAKIREALAHEFELESQHTRVSLSIGAAHYPEHGKDIQTLMRHADVQMYEAKRRLG